MMKNLNRELSFFDTKTFTLQEGMTVAFTIRTVTYKNCEQQDKEVITNQITQLFVSLSLYDQPIATFTKKYTSPSDAAEKHTIYLSKVLATKKSYNLIIDDFNLLLDNFDQRKLSMIMDFLHRIKEIRIIFK